MKKFTLFILIISIASLVKAANLPLDFETGTYTFTNFDGGVVTVINNPQSSGINTSTKVAQMVKSAGQPWGGSWIALDAPINFTTNKLFKMKVYSPRVGAKVLLKVENNSDGAIAFEKEMLTTVANSWEELSFDYSLIDVSKSYQKVVLIFDNGTMGNGSANFTFLFDDLVLTTSGTVTQAPVLPLDFESATLNYDFTNFDGGIATVIDNSQSSGINTSAKIGKMVKNAGQPWGGSWIALAAPIDFTTNKLFKMKVYSPRVGAKVLLKVENNSDGAVSFEKEMLTTVANSWEELSFDYSIIDVTKSYQKIVIIFDNGTIGDGSANFTFLFDDLVLTTSGTVTEAPVLPLNFESPTIDYNFTDFDGGVATVIDNSQSSGINTSAKIGKMVKNAGQPWGGSWIALAAPIDFSAKKLFKMKVFSPRLGAKVLLKVENFSNGSINYEKEVATTVANAWEELSFDFSGINISESYQKITLIFDLGTMGDGSANFTYLFDDIMLVDGTGGLAQIDLPVTFDDETINYSMTDFGGNVSVIVTDPAGGTNNVAKVTKTTGAETWAGTTIGTAAGFATVIPFSATRSKISMRVYSPAAGVNIRLKVENHSDPTLTAETETLTTVANAWETLTFDLSNVATGTNPWNPATKFDKMSVFFNFGKTGANAIYYFDDVVLVIPTQAKNIKSDLANIYSANGKIFVNNAKELINGNIEVYEITGRMVFNKKINGNSETITLNKTGIFIVRVSDTVQNTIISKKIVIN